MSPGRFIAPLVLAYLAATGLSAPSLASEAVAEACLRATPAPSLGAALPRLRAAAQSGGTVRVVALGSSSTRGVGASSWAATYPEVMQRELMRLKPGLKVEIINAGSNGETISGQLARLASDALAPGPTLVVWQLGSNDVVWPWGGIGPDTEARVVDGLRQIRAAGADAVVMDLQNSPLVAGASLRPAMLALTARAARAAGAGHFRRFDLLQRAVQAGVPLSSLTSWDQLHNTDAAYDCTGRALARAIHAAIR